MRFVYSLAEAFHISYDEVDPSPPPLTPLQIHHHRQHHQQQQQQPSPRSMALEAIVYGDQTTPTSVSSSPSSPSASLLPSPTAVGRRNSSYEMVVCESLLYDELPLRTTTTIIIIMMMMMMVRFAHLPLFLSEAVPFGRRRRRIGWPYDR